MWTISVAEDEVDQGERAGLHAEVRGGGLAVEDRRVGFGRSYECDIGSEF